MDKVQLEANVAALKQIRTAIGIALQTIDLTDEQMLSVNTLYPEWTVGDLYAQGSIVRYEGGLYRILQETTARAEHTPDAAVSNYKRIGEPNGDGIFPWIQPLGDKDAYKQGDKVTYEGKTWVSTYEKLNVWVPGVFGWEVVA